MSSYIDKKYINLVSSNLEKFKWKKENLANCRCPLCGDSEENKNKARGYFFEKNNVYFYKCHNCGTSLNVYGFLELISPSLFKQYCLEQFTEKDVRIKETKTVVQYSKCSVTPKHQSIDDLPENHKAIKLLSDRKIPKDKWKLFGYTDKFGDYAKSVNSDYKLINDERLLIPIFDEHNQFVGAQGRSFENIQPRYITLKKDEDVRMIYGMERVDPSQPVFVVEGPIDSLFLPNAIACLGLGNFIEIRKNFPNMNLTFVIDNEPRNRSVANMMKTLISNNEKICIFPSYIKEKDINDMVLNDIDVCDILKNHIFHGAAAMLAFNTWRKCQ
jgi:hypothetical protein